MARLLALEWDGHEARLAVGRRTGRTLLIEEAFSVDLHPRRPGETFADTSIGPRVASALSARGVGRVETLVAVGRASIELRVLSVPPTPEDELPDLVRFQAMRQFTALGDDWPLDFVVLSESDEGISVLAATISPEIVEQIQQTCAAGGLTPCRLVLRPFAAASLLRRRGIDDRCRLMVDLSADEADLTVLVAQRVVFLRTVRLSTAEEAGQTGRALIGEIRRTIVAAQNQLGGRRVEQVILCGHEHQHRQLQSQIEQALSLETETVNPFDVVPLAAELQAHRPEHPGRFGSLLGMLSDEAAGTAPTIDFLHPRKKPEPPSRVGRNSLVAAGVALVVLTVVSLFWLQLAAMDRRIGQLRQTNSRKLELEKQAKRTLERAAEIDQWMEGNLNWLDELRQLSEEFPPADKAIVVQLSANARSRGGRISLTGGINSSQTISEIERAVRDEQHEVRSRGARPSENIEGFSRQFSESIQIKPRDDAAPPPAGSPSTARRREP